VCVQPLTPQQIEGYLGAAGERLAALRAALAQDAALRELAQAPLWLAILTLSCQDQEQAPLPQSGLPAIHNQQLFDIYIARMFQRRGAGSSYTPQQTIRWLGWLARTLPRQAQSSFFIERLQPNWLSTRRQQRTYGALEGLLAGVATGLCAGLFYGVVSGTVSTPLGGPITLLVGAVLRTGAGLDPLIRWGLLPLIGLSAGMLAGLFSGVFYLLASLLAVGDITPQATVAASRWTLARTTLRVSVAFGLAAAMVVGLFYGPAVALIVGLSAGPIGGLIVALGTQPGRIIIVEQLRWTWSRAAWGVVLGAGIGLLAGAALWLVGEPPSWLVIWPVGAMLAFGVIFGLTGGEIGVRMAPNQGIRRSVVTALRVGLVIGALGGAIAALAGGLPHVTVSTLPDRLVFGALFGLMVGIFFGMVYGGAACGQHLLLRLLLWRSGAMPWRYARFLDYAAERVFLRKVGGGYIFIHRLLQEHFAGLPQRGRREREGQGGQSLP
jgi:hypothetical protein